GHHPFWPDVPDAAQILVQCKRPRTSHSDGECSPQAIEAISTSVSWAGADLWLKGQGLQLY
ncbi:hypothetical protein M441DRAFT_123375, partial [Trichoderma asperellum CBS 433.97]